MIQEDFTPDSEGSLLDDSLDGRPKQVLHSPLYEESKYKVNKRDKITPRAWVVLRLVEK